MMEKMIRLVVTLLGSKVFHVELFFCLDYDNFVIMFFFVQNISLILSASLLVLEIVKQNIFY